MEVIFILIGISLVLAVSFLFLFFRALKNGQFDDNYTPSIRMLFEPSTRTKPTKKSPSSKTK